MPVYKCRKCNEMLDPTETVRCPGCNEKKPLSCSKCSEEINHHDIYEIEKLRTKKPLLCKGCGSDNQVVKCPLCGIGLVRSRGVTVSQLATARVYHKACLDQRLQFFATADKAAMVAAAAGLILGIGVMISGYGSNYAIGLLGLGGGIFGVIKALKGFLKSRLY